MSASDRLSRGDEDRLGAASEDDAGAQAAAVQARRERLRAAPASAPPVREARPPIGALFLTLAGGDAKRFRPMRDAFASMAPRFDAVDAEPLTAAAAAHSLRRFAFDRRPGERSVVVVSGALHITEDAPPSLRFHVGPAGPIALLKSPFAASSAVDHLFILDVDVVVDGQTETDPVELYARGLERAFLLDHGPFAVLSRALGDAAPLSPRLAEAILNFDDDAAGGAPAMRLSEWAGGAARARSVAHPEGAPPPIVTARPAEASAIVATRRPRADWEARRAALDALDAPSGSAPSPLLQIGMKFGEKLKQRSQQRAAPKRPRPTPASRLSQPEPFGAPRPIFELDRDAAARARAAFEPAAGAGSAGGEEDAAGRSALDSAIERVRRSGFGGRVDPEAPPTPPRPIAELQSAPSEATSALKPTDDVSPPAAEKAATADQEEASRAAAPDAQIVDDAVEDQSVGETAFDETAREADAPLSEAADLALDAAAFAPSAPPSLDPPAVDAERREPVAPIENATFAPAAASDDAATTENDAPAASETSTDEETAEAAPAEAIDSTAAPEIETVEEAALAAEGAAVRRPDAADDEVAPDIAYAPSAEEAGDRRSEAFDAASSMDAAAAPFELETPEAIAGSEATRAEETSDVGAVAAPVLDAPPSPTPDPINDDLDMRDLDDRAPGEESAVDPELAEYDERAPDIVALDVAAPGLVAPVSVAPVSADPNLVEPSPVALVEEELSPPTESVGEQADAPHAPAAVAVAAVPSTDNAPDEAPDAREEPAPSERAGFDEEPAESDASASTAAPENEPLSAAPPPSPLPMFPVAEIGDAEPTPSDVGGLLIGDALDTGDPIDDASVEPMSPSTPSDLAAVFRTDAAATTSSGDEVVDADEAVDIDEAVDAPKPDRSEDASSERLAFEAAIAAIKAAAPTPPRVDDAPEANPAASTVDAPARPDVIATDEVAAATVDTVDAGAPEMARAPAPLPLFDDVQSSETEAEASSNAASGATVAAPPDHIDFVGEGAAERATQEDASPVEPSRSAPPNVEPAAAIAPDASARRTSGGPDRPVTRVRASRPAKTLVRSRSKERAAAETEADASAAAAPPRPPQKGVAKPTASAARRVTTRVTKPRIPKRVDQTPEADATQNRVRPIDAPSASTTQEPAPSGRPKAVPTARALEAPRTASTEDVGPSPASPRDGEGQSDAPAAAPERTSRPPSVPTKAMRGAEDLATSASAPASTPDAAGAISAKPVAAWAAAMASTTEANETPAVDMSDAAASADAERPVEDPAGEGKFFLSAPERMTVARSSEIVVAISVGDDGRAAVGRATSGVAAAPPSEERTLRTAALMSVVLRDPSSAFDIEPLSDAIQPIDRSTVDALGWPDLRDAEASASSDADRLDSGVWRWRVTPRRRGEYPLTLDAIAYRRTEDGRLAPAPSRNERIFVTVAMNRGRTVRRAALWAVGTLAAIGFGAWAATMIDASGALGVKDALLSELHLLRDELGAIWRWVNHP